MVLLSDSSQFDRLLVGLDAIAPIGFKRQDVFEYDERIAKDLSHRIDWSLLTPYGSLSRQDHCTKSSAFVSSE
jgi:hypothetical protein